MEWGLGFDTIGCPNDDFRNIQCGAALTLCRFLCPVHIILSSLVCLGRCYGETLSKNPEKGLGFMDTDWDGT